jgi:hypothetical protein
MNTHRYGPAALVLATLGVGACATSSTLEPPPQLPRAEIDAEVRAYLRDPLLGYGRNIPEQSRYELQSASRALGRGETPVARAGAETLLAIDPTLLPATVLLAQTALAEGELARVLDLLKEPLAARPGYVAGQLVYARAAELLGDTVTAFGAYLGIAAVDREAAARAPALRAPAVAKLAERTGAAVEEGRLTDAGAALATLREWAADDTATVDLRRRLARARGNSEEELEATRELIASGGTSLELLQRQAALEVESGETSVGLELYEQLAERHPENVEIAAALTAARFTWRTKLLPDRVARLLDASSLLRGDFATLTYWLVAGVRTGSAGGTVIVSDIVEHPQRREIARVLNLGLMTPVDPAVRRFAPNDYMRRGAALAALLRMPGRLGSGAACVGDAGGPAAEDADGVCAAALRCRLISQPSECRAEAAISGSEATEALRRTLHLIQ